MVPISSSRKLLARVLGATGRPMVGRLSTGAPSPARADAVWRYERQSRRVTSAQHDSHSVSDGDADADAVADAAEAQQVLHRREEVTTAKDSALLARCWSRRLDLLRFAMCLYCTRNF